MKRRVKRCEEAMFDADCGEAGYLESVSGEAGVLNRLWLSRFW